MGNDLSKEKQYTKARSKVNRLKIFYIHLCGYAVVVGFIVWNLIIIEEGQYKNPILWLNYSTIIIWGIVIIIHAWTTFKGRILFTKRWEERKIREYLEEEDNKMWE